ncbi:hypothetical protein ACFQU7_28840 [Pseudoroseomonas wenyumeiae]
MLKRRRMAGLLSGSLLALGALPPAAQAQMAPKDTLVVLREIDADRYDPARTSATAAGRRCSC